MSDIKNINEELKTDFLVYAKEVNNNRAFPDVKDGLKPAQRAALYTMYTHGFTSNKPHVKSAKITGAVIGELWPHGDTSSYDTIVRMSQPWITNIPEVDFHGANGSLQGGPEAANQRYTEARLSKAVEDGFFNNIKKDVVPMIPNFSEDMEWPLVFPAIFPRLFVNGSQGIGYTIAQEWQPGNLNEFTAQVKLYLKNKKLDYFNIYPDYPTGGIIINKNDLHTIYETGKGSVILRAKTEITDNIIRITELPYQVYAEAFIQKVKDLVNADQLTGIDDIFNKSDDNGLCIEIECSEDPNLILTKLYKLTDLQVTFSANQMALLDGEPVMFNLEKYIKTYIDHNIECIKKEYIYDLEKAQSRLEIVEGLVKALENIDNVIQIIKKSKSSSEAITNLINAYKFTENQAKAIVDMRLGKLANLETIELNEEQKELTENIDRYLKFLASDTDQKNEFIKRLDEFTKKYGWERRTQVDQIDIIKEKAEIKASKTITEDYIVVLTKYNTIKRIKLADYRPNSKIKNDSDEIINAVKVGAKDKVILLSSSGKMYKLQTNKITLGNMKSTGDSLDNIFSDKIIALYSGHEEEKYLFFITKAGLVKKMNQADLFTLSKCIGTAAMKVNDDDEIIYITLTNDREINVEVNKKVKVLNTAKFNTKGRTAGGQAGIKLKEGQTFKILD